MLKSFDWYETIGIVLAIVLASVISSISEYGSNKTFEHLQAQLNDYNTLVYRNNKLIEIRSGDVVVNDIIKVMGGSKIPADGIIIDGSISVDESFLSGEVNEKNKKINDNVYKETNVYKDYISLKQSILIKLHEKFGYNVDMLKLPIDAPDSEKKPFCEIGFLLYQG